MLISRKLANLLNNAYLLEEITKYSEIEEASGASSCVVRNCHSGAEQAVKPLDSKDGGHDKENTDLRVLLLVSF